MSSRYAPFLTRPVTCNNAVAAATTQDSSVCPRSPSSQMPLNVHASDPIERLVNRELVMVLADAQATVPAPTRGRPAASKASHVSKMAPLSVALVLAA